MTTPYRGGTCRAGGEHEFQKFDKTRMGPMLSAMFGEFTACGKCGMRPEERCPKSPAGHGDHNYQPHKHMTEYGIVDAGKCSMCGKVIR